MVKLYWEIMDELPFDEMMSSKGYKQMSASDKTGYGELVETRNYFFMMSNDKEKEVKSLKQEIEPLRKQKSEYDFFFDQERFLKDALDTESKESS
jgi:hypothetical protein